MIREGEPNVTLKFLAESPSKLAISNFSDGEFRLWPLRVRQDFEISQREKDVH